MVQGTVHATGMRHIGLQASAILGFTPQPSWHVVSSTLCRQAADCDTAHEVRELNSGMGAAGVGAGVGSAKKISVWCPQGLLAAGLKPAAGTLSITLYSKRHRLFCK